MQRLFKRSRIDRPAGDRPARDRHGVGDLAAQVRERVGQLDEVLTKLAEPFLLADKVQFFTKGDQGSSDIVELLDQGE